MEVISNPKKVKVTRNQFSILIGGACSVLVGCWSWVSVNQSELNLWNIMSIIIHRLSDELYCDLLHSKKSCQECIFCEFVWRQNTFLLTQILYTLLFNCRYDKRFNFKNLPNTMFIIKIELLHKKWMKPPTQEREPII